MFPSSAEAREVFAQTVSIVRIGFFAVKRQTAHVRLRKASAASTHLQHRFQLALIKQIDFLC
jgi:hypothetical protein